MRNVPCLNYSKSKILAKGNKFAIIFDVVSRTFIYDNRDRLLEIFLHCYECRKERMFIEGQLFSERTLGFTPVFGLKNSMIIRKSSQKTTEYKEIISSDQVFGGFEIRTVEDKALKPVDKLSESIPHFFNMEDVVAQTIFKNRKGIKVVIRYPVRTINISEKNNTIQVDTGPVCVPSLDAGASDFIDDMTLAHVAFNNDKEVSFVKEARTATGGFDFVDRIACEAHNTLYCKG